MKRIEKYGLQVDERLVDFIEATALPGTEIGQVQFWKGLSKLVHEKGPKNRALLEKRANIQGQIDAWHIARKGQDFDFSEYKAFLTEIDYLVPEGPDFAIETKNVDPEIATLPGPQLVVPIMNARFALNAANARFGSLYDCLYGTEAMGSLPTGKGYDPLRGAEVITWAKAFLDDVFPIVGMSHSDATRYWIEDGKLLIDGHGLQDPSVFVGYRNEPEAPGGVLLRNNGLHVELYFELASPISKQDKAGLSDVILESAISTIMDCEDSVAAVDAEDKVLAYRAMQLTPAPTRCCV